MRDVPQRWAMLCVVSVAAVAGGADVEILNEKSYWRAFFVNRPPVVRLDDGLYAVSEHGATAAPAPGWAETDFDDAGWARLANPGFPPADRGFGLAGWCAKTGTRTTHAATYLRGKFFVADPAKAAGVKLSLRYRGGVVVYVNGAELLRRHLPAAALTPDTLAEDYPAEAFIDTRGRPLRIQTAAKKYADRLALRTRATGDIAIPASMLRRRVNVLAIELHRAAWHKATVGGKKPRSRKTLPKFFQDRISSASTEAWSTVGLVGANLTAAAGVTPAAGRPGGFQLWNNDVLAPVYEVDYGDPAEPLRPIVIVAARNGTFSGKVVAGSDKPIRGLSVSVSALKRAGGGEIAPAAVRIRYAVGTMEEELAYTRFPDLRHTYLARHDLRRYDGLHAEPPATVAVVRKEPARAGITLRDGAVLPIWVTVRVPAGAAPGEYRGRLSVRADGVETVGVPVHLTVSPFVLPDATDFVTFVDMVQSPESVAMQYGVPLWSKRHFELMARSFALMRRVRNRTLYLPLIARASFGNAETMLRRVRGDDGKLTCDFSALERYLDTAIEHMGKPEIVIAQVWDVHLGGGYFGKTVPKEQWAPVGYTLLGPATGKATEAAGPKFGTDEARAFWRPVIAGLRQRMKKRGLLKAMMFGPCSDVKPGKEVVDLLTELSPGTKWVEQSHSIFPDIHGAPVGYSTTVWSARFANDPAVGRMYGWMRPNSTGRGKRPPLIAHYPRRQFSTKLLVDYRLICEYEVTGLQPGFGRIGADFWPVIKGKKSDRGVRLPQRYPESSWKQLTLRTDWLAPGPDGAVSSVRFEMVVEGLQETEARIFIEKSLLDPAKKAALGDPLAKRCQAALDRRTRALIAAGRPGGSVQSFPSTQLTQFLYLAGDWQGRSKTLFDLAAEVAAKRQ